MNRRDFLRNFSLFVMAGMMTNSPLWAAGSGRPGLFHPLRRGAGYFIGRGGSIAWLVNDEALAVVDTQFPPTAMTCLAGLPGRADRMIDIVLNTHHHSDHTSGNGVFRKVAKSIVAHENVPALQRASAAKAGKGETPVTADETFATSWRRELGDEIVTAQYFGNAHTSGDAIVHFEKANVVHMGDLVFNRMYPYIDVPAGANVQHWITVLEDAMKHYPADAIYVCGHGKAGFGVEGTQDTLRVFRDHLNAMLEHVEKGIAAGQSKAEIVARDNMASMPEFHTNKANRLSRNLGIVYDELTGRAP